MSYTITPRCPTNVRRSSERSISPNPTKYDIIMLSYLLFFPFLSPLSIRCLYSMELNYMGGEVPAMANLARVPKHDDLTRAGQRYLPKVVFWVFPLPFPFFISSQLSFRFVLGNTEASMGAREAWIFLIFFKKMLSNMLGRWGWGSQGIDSILCFL